MDMKFNIMDDHPAETKKASFVDVDFSKLETELRDYVIKQEVCVCVCVCVCLCVKACCREALKGSV